MPELQQSDKPKPRRRRATDPGILALKHYVKVLQTQDVDAQRAAILWLADRFLGLKPRDWWK